MLFVRDVAARRGVDTSTARRWLVDLERQHGARIVGRLGKRLYTTEEALAEVGPSIARLDLGQETARRLGNRLTNCTLRLGRLADTVRELTERVARLEAPQHTPSVM